MSRPRTLRHLRRSSGGLSLILLAALSASLFAQAPPSGDTFVTSTFPSTNFGSVNSLAVAPGTTSYAQFNLSGIPKDATIMKASLRLYVDAVVSPGNFDVYEVDKSWSERAVTYNTQPLPLGPSATANNPVSISTASLNQFVLIDITPLVHGWMSGTPQNHGVALALTSANRKILGALIK